MRLRLLGALVILTASAGLSASSAIKLVRNFQLQPPHDRRIVFSMALTENQDLLSFIASPDGKWRLSRVRGWFNEQPQEDRIVVPGLVLGDRKDWFSPWSAKLLLTPDGKFVICIASASRSGGRGDEEFVSVVSLAEFKVVASAHPPELPALTGSYRLYNLDRRGNLVAQAHTPFPRHPGDDISVGGSQVKMAVLSLPGLELSDQCKYSEWTRSNSPTRLAEYDSCNDLLAHEGGFASVLDFIGSFVQTGEVSRTNELARPSTCAFLGYARYLSRDGRYEREICLASHRGFWGGLVVTRAVENIFSTETGKQVGSVEEPTDSVESGFASVYGREYLLVMEGGTRLMIYQISQ
jgi:hypothetical protein